MKKKTLVIGWDGADWKFITPLLDQGLMPNLERLINGGVMGKIATLDPPLSPTLWTSIATGKRPYKHGIHGFVEPAPSGNSIRPMYITNRKCKAIWNILTQHQLKTHVVGWWPSHPAEPINGIMVSNLYQRSNKIINEEWPMLAGTVHPAAMEDTFKTLRVHREELTFAHILPFVPKFSELGDPRDGRLRNLAAVTSDCATVHSAATYIMDTQEWDFMAVYYDGIDHYCHGFMKYHPPRRPHIPKKDFEIYKDVVNGACRYHDLMLGKLMEQAGKDTNIILLSDHGFHPGHNRPNKLPKEPTGPALEHSPYGVLVMKGPDIKKDASLFGASLLDITPTILAMHDLPVGLDMDGRVLVNAFAKSPEIKTIKSWENIKGPSGQHPEGVEVDQVQSQEEIQQLVDLGYIENPGNDIEKAIQNTIDENEYNLARAYIDGQQWDEGVALLEKLHRKKPDVLRYATRLLHCYQATGQFKEARKLSDTIRQHHDVLDVQLDILEGNLLLSEGRPLKAVSIFEKVLGEAGDIPLINLRIAQAYLSMNRLEKAETAVKKALEENPEQIAAHFALGQIRFRDMDYQGALDAYMEVVGLDYQSPGAHFSIGNCLYEMKQYEEAITAWEVALKISPSFNNARERIIHTLVDRIGQPGRAKQYQVSFMENLQGTINIVSGLPRSGTSMMMQMLEAGGLQIFTDKVRNADESNPKGYYEHEAVKGLARNKGFLVEATGRTVKVIAHLLHHLPMTYRYRVVFMERDLVEIVQSQQRMLVRQGKRVDMDTIPLTLMDKYKKSMDKAVQWMQQHPNVDFIRLRYSDIMQQPFAQSLLINDLFDGKLRVEDMAQVPKPHLYRERSK